MAGFTIVSGRVRDANNVLVPIRGISHYGWAPLGWPQYLWQQNWQAQLDQIKSMGFNNVRTPVSPLVIHSARICPDTYRSGTGTVSPTINPDLIGLTPLQILDKYMAYCDKIGLYVLLDMHSILYEPPSGTRLGVWECTTAMTAYSPYLWKAAPYTATDWINDLVFLATRYSSNAHFMAIEPFNEPHDEGSGHPRWDSGDPLMTDSLQYWRPNVENAAEAILAANPNLLICVQGCIASDGVSPAVPINWGEDLRPQAYKPLNTAKLPVNKTIFTPHSYGPDVFVKSSFTSGSFPSNLAANWEATFGFLYPTFCVAPSEWGGHYGTGTGSGGGAYPPGITAATDKVWQDAFRDWMNTKGMHDSWYWAYPQANDDAGSILDGSLNVRQDKLALLQSHWTIPPVALTIPRNTTFDTRAFAPYIKNAFPAQSHAIGAVVALNLAFYVAGGVSPTYAMSPSVPGLSLNASTGMLTGTVTTAQAATTMTVTVTNSVGSIQRTFSWTITSTLDIADLPNPLVLARGQSYDLTVQGSPASIVDAVSHPGVTYTASPPRIVVASNAQLGTTNNHRLTAIPAALADWTTRSAGAAQAIRFGGSAANVNAYIHQDGGQANVTWNPTGGILGDGCLRIVRAVGGGSGNWRAPLATVFPILNGQEGQGFGLATPFWIQYRFRLGPGRLTPNQSAGFKISDISQYNSTNPVNSRSHTNGEIVLQNIDWNGSPRSYRDVGWTGTPPWPGTPPVYPLAENIWYTVMFRCEFPTWSNSSGAGNRFQVWIAAQGAGSWTTLYDLSGNNAIIGSNNGDAHTDIPNGHSGIWFNDFETDLVTALTATYQEYDQLIVSLSSIAIPAA